MQHKDEVVKTHHGNRGTIPKIRHRPIRFTRKISGRHIFKQRDDLDARRAEVADPLGDGDVVGAKTQVLAADDLVGVVAVDAVDGAG